LANYEESGKSAKYRSLAALYRFIPVAVEILGVLSEDPSTWFRDLGHRITAVTSDN
jgi:hypothetical protein